MINRIKVLILFLLLISTNVLFARITVSSKIDTSIATIGDQITLDVMVLYPEENTTISFSEINDEFQQFSVVSRNETKAEKIAMGYQKEFQFKIAVFDTGKTELPPLTVETKVDTNSALIFKTNSHFVNIISVLPPDENVDPKEIKMPFPLPTVLPWDYIIFALIIIGIALIWYLLHKKWKRDHPTVDFNEKYLDPPHVIALRKLSTIKGYPFTTETEIITTYTDISHVVREYLEGRYFIRALEMPTRDIIESAKDIEIDDTILMKLQDILSRLDIIKFANQLPAVSEKDDIITISEKIIQTTKIDDFLSQRSGLTDAKESLGK